MATRRHGSRTGFFDGTTTFNQGTAPYGGVSVPAGATSRTQEIGRTGDNFSVFVNANGASTWLAQVAHSGDIDTQGVLPDPDSQTFTWHDLYYLGTGTNGSRCEIALAAAGQICMLIPDFTSGWIRLKRTDGGANVTVTAGWEMQGD